MTTHVTGRATSALPTHNDSFERLRGGGHTPPANSPREHAEPGGDRHARPGPHRGLFLDRRTLRVLCVVGHLIFAGCERDGVRSTFQTLGVTDAPVLPPVAIAVVCDPTEGSPCERGSVQTLVSRAVDTAFGRPGSTVRVIVLGATPGETRHVATLTTPPAAERSARAARLARERFLATVEATICPGLDATLTRSRPRASHIAEALDEVVLARDPHLPLVILAMSDGREVSALGDFECRALPSVEAFRSRLAARNLLVRRSFEGSFVTFVVGDRGPVLRRDCTVSMGRERQVQALWTGALRAAGARDVRFVADLPSDADLSALFGAVSQDGGVQ